MPDFTPPSNTLSQTLGHLWTLTLKGIMPVLLSEIVSAQYPDAGYVGPEARDVLANLAYLESTGLVEETNTVLGELRLTAKGTEAARLRFTPGEGATDYQPRVNFVLSVGDLERHAPMLWAMFSGISMLRAETKVVIPRTAAFPEALIRDVEEAEAEARTYQVQAVVNDWAKGNSLLEQTGSALARALTLMLAAGVEEEVSREVVDLEDRLLGGNITKGEDWRGYRERG